MRQASCCTLASSLEYAVWPSKSEASLECMTWNMLRRCCLQRDPPVTWLVFVPFWLSYVPSWRWFCCQQTNSNQKSHMHLLNGSKEVHATKRKSFWKAFRHLACRSLAPKNNIYISTKNRRGAGAPRYSWGRSARSEDPPLPPQQRKPWPCRRRSRTPGGIEPPARRDYSGYRSNKGNLQSSTFKFQRGWKALQCPVAPVLAGHIVHLTIHRLSAGRVTRRIAIRARKSNTVQISLMDKIAPVQNERDFAREGNVLAEGSAKGVSRTLCLCLSLSLSLPIPGHLVDG